MAFDGSAIAAITYELNNRLNNGRIIKIAQPEKDELVFTIKNNREQLKLLVSANASLPLANLTTRNKTSPLTAPNFCMLLRNILVEEKF
jgi:predicted ribosome quality control (RQC) complex YloA/Tae2 family protein